MAKTWLSITVELLGGRGEEFWPYPGRTFAVGPSHTFDDFATAINVAFARWDFAHLDQFTFADGTMVTNPESALELLESGAGPMLRPLNIYATKVSRIVKPGDEFQFVFDLGDHWVHRCTVHPKKVDPVEVLGVRPKEPAAFWGWGNMPDQYGRRWMSDDGQSSLPRRPVAAEPMSTYAWPESQPITSEALEVVRRAITEQDGHSFYNAMVGYLIDDHLQEFAAASPMLLEVRSDQNEAIVLSFINRLSLRGEPGDAELSETLLAKLREG